MSSEVVVHVVDDDEGIRESLALLLNSHNIPCATHASAEAFLNAVPNLTSGCVLTDVRLPGKSGLDLLHQLTHPRRAILIIVMTGHGDVPIAVEAMKRGADDFLEKPIDGDLLLASIRAGLSRILESDRQQAEQADALERIRRLSPRERAVLDGLAAGKPNKVIAFELNISPRTVEVHRANLMRKMQSASLSNLVRLTILATAQER
jgi:two-component system response regulator FixJ